MSTIRSVRRAWLESEFETHLQKIIGFRMHYGRPGMEMKMISSKAGALFNSNRLNELKSNVDKYIYGPDTSTPIWRKLISDLKSEVAQSEFLQTNDMLLRSLELNEWEEIKDIDDVTINFITLIAEYLLKGIIYQINEDFDFPEFKLASNSAILRNNISAYGLKNNIDIFFKCKSELESHFSENYSRELVRVNAALDIIHVDYDAEIKYQDAIVGKTSNYRDHVRSLEKIITYIINSNKNTIYSKTFVRKILINMVVK